MGWGWLKPVLEFFKQWFTEAATAETKSSEAKTTNETCTKFQEQLASRIKREPPAGTH